jgi:GxxExxY protein
MSGTGFRSRGFDDLGGAPGGDRDAMGRVKLVEERLTHSAIGAFFEVYNTLGYGFLEHLYVRAMEEELLARGHRVAREVGVRVMYKGIKLGVQRLDLIVDDRLVIEAKASSELHKAASRQLYNYLRATNLKVGLLLHFGPEPTFHRIISPTHRSNPKHQPGSEASVLKSSVSVASDPQAVTKVETAGGPEPAPSSCLKNT